MVTIVLSLLAVLCFLEVGGTITLIMNNVSKLNLPPFSLLLSVLKDSGFTQEQVCKAAGISNPALNEETLSFFSLARIYQISLTQLELNLAQIEARPVVGKKSYEMLLKCTLHCRNLAEVFDEVCYFYEMLGAGRGIFSLNSDNGIATFKIKREQDTPLPVTYLLMQAGLAAHYSLISWLIGRNLEIKTIDLSCPTEFEYIAGGIINAPVNYVTDGYAFSFDSAWLEYPVIRSSSDLASVLPLFPFDLMLNQTLNEGLVQRIRLLIASMLSKDQLPPDLQSTATLLNLGASTLRRHLQKEQLSFQKIKEEVLVEIATNWLREGNFDIEEIALKLGFSEARSFRRAFKRWTGKNPSSMRS